MSRLEIIQQSIDLNLILVRKMIHFVRHAESIYNWVERQIKKKCGEHYFDLPEYLEEKFNRKYMDVEITEQGIQQAEELRQLIQNETFDVILVSPMRRALKTCSIAFQDHIGKTQIIVQPAFRQIMQSSNDIGTEIKESILKYPQFNFKNIQDREAWFVATLSQEKDREEVYQKLKGLQGEQRREKAIEECLRIQKENWFERRKHPENEEHLKHRVLPSFQEQTKVIKSYLQKHKKIAIVAHSECIKTYAGYKIKNCEVFVYKFES